MQGFTLKMKEKLLCWPGFCLWSAFILGASIWYVPLWLGLLFVCFGFFAIAGLGGVSKPWRGVAFTYLFFTLFWAGGRFCLVLYNGQNLASASSEAMDFACRLCFIGQVGLCLLIIFTPYKIARQVGKSFKKLAPGHFWKLSLALLLMLSFLQEARLALRGLNQTLSLRGQHLSFFRRIIVLGAGILRILSRQTWDRALAVVARKLDNPAAWE